VLATLETTAAGTCAEQRRVERFGSLSAYCTGWSLCDAETIRSAAADDHLWDDPAVGRVSKDDLGVVLPGCMARIDGLRGGRSRQPYQVI